MRNSLGLLLRRGTVSALSLAALCAPGGPAAAAPAPPGAGDRVAAEAEGLPFAQRYRALLHGGIVRAANTSITCRGPLAPTTVSCPAARAGAAVPNDGFDMFYTDVDSDPNTYNSSRATVALPAGAEVAYARLYWGGNLRAGEQKPPRDNGRVLFAEPGGRYKEVLADTVVGHRVARGADAYQASADVTRLVRPAGAGAYTVAQVNVARGHSAAGAWGGWTLVVAYEKESEPLRHLALWDGFGPLGPDDDQVHPGDGHADPGDGRADPEDGQVAPGDGQVVRMRDLDFPAGAAGRVGLVAYDGDRGRTGDAFTVSDGRGVAVPLRNGANPRDDVLNSTIGEPDGGTASVRTPAYPNTLGYDSDVLDLGEGLRRGGDLLEFRLVSRRDAVWAGALFVAVDAKR